MAIEFCKKSVAESRPHPPRYPRAPRMRRKKKEAGRGREGKYPGRRLRDKDEDGRRRGWPARGHDALAGKDARRADGKMRA